MGLTDMIYANIHAEGRSNNSLFQNDDAVHRHNPTYTPRLLRQTFLAQGIELPVPELQRLGNAVRHQHHRPLALAVPEADTGTLDRNE